MTHAVAWLEHSRARIIDFSTRRDRRIAPASSAGRSQLHHKEGAVGSGRAKRDRELFESIADALVDSAQILPVGPASAKNELAEYLARHRPPTHSRIVGIETVDHSPENQLLAYARAWFDASGRRVGPAGPTR